MSLLSDIIGKTEADLVERKLRVPLSELQRMVKDAPPTRSLQKALSRAGFSIIGEIKRRSPSAREMNPVNVAHAIQAYNVSPAISAISVLTDEPFFGGSLKQLMDVRKQTNKPILRKDFIVDAYQVWEARAFGADAILLMGSVHEKRPGLMKGLHDLAKSLGLETLVEIGMSEAGPEKQVEIVPPDATIWGINSREFHTTRLKTRVHLSKLFNRDFLTYPERHYQLRNLIPPGKIAVAESGIKKPGDLKPIAELNYSAALIGTAFLKSKRAIAEVVSDFAAQIGDLKQGRLNIAQPNYSWPRSAAR